MAVDEAALDAFLADPSTPGGDLNPTGEAAAAPAETPAVETPAAEVEHTIPEPTAEQDSFDRAYVEKLRRESAGYRERAKRYNDVFDGYEEDAVNEWLELASTLKNDPRAAAERFQTIAQAILEAQEEVAPEAPVDHAAQDAPLTRAEFEALMAEREQQAALKARTIQIEVDAKSLGYEKGTEDYDELLFVASRLPNGSIQDAHAKITAKRQAVIDRYVASLAAKPAPTVPDPNGAPASGERKIRSFDEANTALDAWLANQA